MDAPMATDADGAQLVGFDVLGEPGIDDAEATPLTAALVIVERDDTILLVHDRWKQAWELPGGGREPGETPRQTAIRELAEESGVRADDLVFAGVARYILPPDRRRERLAIYRTTIDLDPVPSCQPNDEIAAVRWWRPAEQIDQLSTLDAALVRHILQMSEWETTIATYQQLAQRYATRTVPTSPENRAPLLDRIADLLPHGRMLELGSGPGWDADYLEAQGLTVRRSDATPAFVEMMRAGGAAAELVDVRTDDLGGPWDGVLANAVLLHLTRDEFATAVGRIRGAVRPGGLFVFTLKEGDGEAWSAAKLDLPRWFVYWREPELRTVLGRQGWQIESLEQRPGRHEDWIQVIARPSVAHQGP